MQEPKSVMRHERLHDSYGRPHQRPAARGRFDRDDAELLILGREKNAICQLVVSGYLTSIVDRAEKNKCPMKSGSRIRAVKRSASRDHARRQS